MELRRLLVIARRRLVLVAVLVLAGMAAAYLGSSRTSTYAAQTTIYIGEPSTSLNPSLQYGQAVLAATLTSTIPTPSVVGRAVTDLHVARQVNAVVKETTATVQPGTNLIRVTVRDQDPVVAQQLANTVSTVFVAQTTTLLPVIAASGGPRNQPIASIAQQAVVPSAPLATNRNRNIALGGLIGLLVGVALVLVLDFVGLSARPPQQLEDLMGMSLIGVVPLQPQIERTGTVAPGTRPEDVLLLRGEGA
jgi:receptor protein-tyrosine kinase